MQTLGRSHNEFDFSSYSLARRQLVVTRLAEYMASGSTGVLPESMSYSVLSGGKRLRALLCLASAEAIVGLGGNLEHVLPL